MKPLNMFLEKSFNSLNTVEMHRWLIQEREEGHEERMKILGNVVVPACASLAAEILRSVAET